MWAHHEVTFWVEGVGSTHIHPPILHGVEYPDEVLTLYL